MIFSIVLKIILFFCLYFLLLNLFFCFIVSILFLNSLSLISYAFVIQENLFLRNQIKKIFLRYFKNYFSFQVLFKMNNYLT